MMDFKIKSFIALLIISMFMLSGCEVYQTLYGNTTSVPTGNVVAHPKNETAEVAVANETNASNESYTEPAAPNEIGHSAEVIPTESNETVQPAKEKPVVVVVQETDTVNLIPKAYDPDKGTKLTFSFTSPLNDNGEWKTTYGDAGEYTVTVTVSDGEATTSRDVLIIVNKKEEPPTIDTSKPVESGITIYETQAIDFSVIASDLNKDPLSYTWKLDGVSVGTEDKYSYETDYDSAGTHTVKVDVSDGVTNASRIWSVNVINVNRKPLLEKVSDVKAKETDKIVVTIVASDGDKDPLNYSINDKRFTQEGNVFTWQTDYDSAGAYKEVVSVSDGQDTTSQEFTIDVANVNRPPVITDVLQKQ